MRRRPAGTDWSNCHFGGRDRRRTILAVMIDPDTPIGEDAPEADVAEQRTPVADEDDWVDSPLGTDREASEADLIDQAIAVPLPDDDPERE